MFLRVNITRSVTTKRVGVCYEMHSQRSSSASLRQVFYSIAVKPSYYVVMKGSSTWLFHSSYWRKKTTTYCEIKRLESLITPSENLEGGPFTLRLMPETHFDIIHICIQTLEARFFSRYLPQMLVEFDNYTTFGHSHFSHNGANLNNNN